MLKFSHSHITHTPRGLDVSVGACVIVMGCDAVHLVNAPHLGQPIIHGCIV